MLQSEQKHVALIKQFVWKFLNANSYAMGRFVGTLSTAKEGLLHDEDVRILKQENDGSCMLKLMVGI